MDIAVVEIRVVKSATQTDFDKRSVELLAGSFEDADFPFTDCSRYSLSFVNSSVSTKVAREELWPLLKKHDLILAVGAEAMHLLCNTRKTLDKYSGSLTWNSNLESWILPSYHPSVVYVGPPETLNSRYDKFDCLFDHIHRFVGLATGKIDFPPIEGHKIEWSHIGNENYWDATDEDVTEAKAFFTYWLDFLDNLRDETTTTFALDTESRDLNVFRENAFLMLQLCSGSKAWAFNAGVVTHPFVKPLVQLFLNHKNARFTVHNLKYDLQVIKHEFGLDISDRSVCTLAMALGTTEKAKQTSLKYQSRQKLNAPFYEEALDDYIDWDNVDFSMVPPHILAEYGCKDVYYGYHLLPILVEEIKEEKTGKAVKELLLPAQYTFADIEYQGFYADVDYAKRKSAEWEPVIDDAIKKVQEYAEEAGFPLDADKVAGQAYKSVCDCVPARGRFHLEGLRVLSYGKALREAGFVLDDCRSCKNKRYVTRSDRTLNVNSSAHMQHLCFDVLGMKEVPYAGRSCNKEFWKYNANHELAKLVSVYKELQYLRRNFLEGIQRFVAEDGKVHPNFNLFGTKTGRISVNNPAMQTVPKHSENAKVIRRLFLPDPGCLIVDADYKSLEMFIAHHLTGDPKLLENLTGEWDVHTALAAEVYSKKPQDVTSDERQSVKSVNFGAGYGISGFKLSLDPAMEEATGGDPEIAQDFLDTFWNMYSVWADKCDEWREQVLSRQYLYTELGRKRRWNLITGDNYGKAQNQGINFPGQSMASDLCLSSLVKLHWKLHDKGWGRVLLSVHDSLVFNIRKEYLHNAISLIRKEMTTPPFETTTPFEVDIEVGPNYGDKEAYDESKDYTLV